MIFKWIKKIINRFVMGVWRFFFHFVVIVSDLELFWEKVFFN